MWCNILRDTLHICKAWVEIYLEAHKEMFKECVKHNIILPLKQEEALYL